MDNLEEYNIDFQGMIDNLTIQELRQFKEKLVRVYAKRLAKELEATNERLKMLNNLQDT
tara:strand:- start:23729 stop:23905 length:177 start_codon:yes stop_codon:yes gene_type:complete